MYAALNERDIEAALGYMHPEVIANSLVMESEGTAYRGHEGARRFMEDLLGVFPDWHGEVEQAEETPDQVIARIHVGGHAAASGVGVDQRAYLAARLRDGLFVELHFVRTEEEARGAMVPRS
jgi:ketosteroid isomerase-like protein